MKQPGPPWISVRVVFFWYDHALALTLPTVKFYNKYCLVSAFFKGRKVQKGYIPYKVKSKMVIPQHL
ncbi:hypothetical protein BLX87_21310 [Bacillus sp. VT-16-64]|nr:hypothetical protein BLX87_21310 [Bacillus sp. VT-16-64]